MECSAVFDAKDHIRIVPAHIDKNGKVHCIMSSKWKFIKVENFITKDEDAMKKHKKY